MTDLTQISAYDYDLPSGLIAQTPAVPRQSANLMVLSRADGSITGKKISDLPDYFRKGDIVVINNTKVFKARLFGTVNPDNYRVELFLVRPLPDNQWLALGKPGKKFKPGSIVRIAADFDAEVISYFGDGTMKVNFNMPPDEVIRLSNRYGHVPQPPYIKKEPQASDYQTSYAKIEGSVAAPTAGFHLTPEIRKRLTGKGVEILEITLHVGLGTFLPVKTAKIDAHKMHTE
jgi:S-adenosylmethionine:tRNA ribosyltransferase-isomerase